MTDDESVGARPHWFPAVFALLEQTVGPVLRADRVVVELEFDGADSADSAVDRVAGAVLRLPWPMHRGPLATVVVHRRGPPFTQDERVLGDHLVGLAASALAGRAHEDTAEIATAFVEETLRALDEMGAARVEDRLALVGDAALRHFRCAAWWLGAVHGDLVLPLAHDARDEATALRIRQAARAPRLLRTPAVAGVLEGGSLSATRDDPALGGYLRDAGMTEILAAGGYDVDALQWLLAIADDGAGYELRDARAGFFSAVQAGLGFPRGPRPRG